MGGSAVRGFPGRLPGVHGRRGRAARQGDSSLTAVVAQWEITSDNRSSTAAEIQAASCTQEESEFTRLVLADALFGGICLKRWTDDVLKVPGALILDAKCVFDALARSESSALGMSDKRSALEALALKKAMMATQTAMRWCHSAAQLADGLTKAKTESRAAWDLLVRRGWLWKLTYDPDFVSAKNREKNGQGILDGNCITELTPDMTFDDGQNIDLEMYQPRVPAGGTTALEL